MTKFTMTKRFYMGTSGITPNNTELLKTLAEATNQAREYLEDNPSCEERYIVEVIRVVRRERTPIVIADVRK